MSTIVTRAGKGAPLTHNEVDANFTNLNADKYQAGDNPSFGNITVTGTVDGRDVAADGSKLDGIEAGATADQTAAEILTAIKTVDGASSGLDADLLDGNHASAFSLTSHNHTLDSLSNTTITSIAAGEILKWDGAAWINNTLAEAGIQPAGSYLTGNQTITLSGDLSGSGTTSINAQIAANVVGANELNVVGNGTTAQYLRSDGDGSFTWATPTDTNTTYTAGGGLTLAGTVFSHTDTSTQASVNNSGATVIQDVTLDTYGHVTGLASATIIAPTTSGTTGQILTSNGTSTPTWEDASSGGVPAGTVIWYASSTPPTGYIKANGATVSRTTYADLFAAIGTTFGVGDGSTTFQIPDLRGEFVRGWDDSRGVDSGRSFGSAQADAFKSHTHDARDGTGGSGTNSITNGGGNFSGQDYSLAWRSSTTYTLIRETGDIETRPRNIAMLACIKY